MTAPSAASWYLGTINAAKIQTNLTDPINANSGPLLGESNVATAVTLATVATDVASSASVTFTLAAQRRVFVVGLVHFQLGTTTAGGYMAQVAYSVGSSVNLASSTKIGRAARQYNNSGLANNNGAASSTPIGSVVLAAGTYTVFLACTRNVGGSATDVAFNFDILALDCGPS